MSLDCFPKILLSHFRHSRESGSPERIKKTGFLLSQELRIEIEKEFFRKLLKESAAEAHLRRSFAGRAQKLNYSLFLNSVIKK